MANSTQVRELFGRIQHPQLQDMVKAIEVIFVLKCITYSEADNQITSAVYKIPKYQFSQKNSNIQASGDNSGDNGGGGSPRKCSCNSSSIYNSQEKVHTGYYLNKNGLSKEDHKTIIASRKKGYQV